jgi:hypothetical protein
MSYPFGAADAVTLGLGAGASGQNASAVAIGKFAGQVNQGQNSIAIGTNAGTLNQLPCTIMINATGEHFNGAAQGATYFTPVRNLSTTTLLQYNPGTAEIVYSNGINGNFTVMSSFTANSTTTLSTVNAVNVNYTTLVGSTLTVNSTATTSTLNAVNVNYTTLVGSTLTVNSTATTSTLNAVNVNYNILTGSTLTVNSTATISSITARNVGYSTLIGSTITCNTIAINTSATNTATVNSTLTTSTITSGTVGIGTASPVSMLTIWNQTTLNISPNLSLVGYSTSPGTGPGINFYCWISAITPQSRIEAYDDNNYGSWLTFSTKINGDGSNLLRESLRLGGPSGFVGIGTASPRRLLDIVGVPSYPNVTDATQLSISDSANSSYMNLLLGARYVGTATSYGSIQASLSGSGPTNLILNPAGGNVGIGYTTPQFAVHAAGGTIAANTFRIQTGYDSTGWYGFNISGYDTGVNGTNLTFNARPGSDNAFNTVMTITNGGLVGIGNTNPKALLHLGNASVSNSNATLILAKNNGLGGTRHNLIGYDADFNFVLCGDYGGNNDVAVWKKQLYCSYNAPENSFVIDTSGKIGVGTASPGYTLHVIGTIYASGNITGLSDKRYKTDVEPIHNALEKVNTLQGCSYLRTDYLVGERQLGLIAQDVQQVFPEAVSYDTVNDMYSLNYGCLIAPVIEALKELKALRERDVAEIDELKALRERDVAEIGELKSKIELLTASFI